MLKYLYTVCGYACTQETQAYIHNGIMCTNKDIHSIQRTVVMRQNLQCYVLVCMIACMCIVVYYCVLCSVCHNSLHQCPPPPLSYYVICTFGPVDLSMFSPTPHVCRCTITISVHVLLLVWIQLYCSDIC